MPSRQPRLSLQGSGGNSSSPVLKVLKGCQTQAEIPALVTQRSVGLVGLPLRKAEPEQPEPAPKQERSGPGIAHEGCQLPKVAHGVEGNRGPDAHPCPLLCTHCFNTVLRKAGRFTREASSGRWRGLTLCPAALGGFLGAAIARLLSFLDSLRPLKGAPAVGSRQLDAVGRGCSRAGKAAEHTLGESCE